MAIQTEQQNLTNVEEVGHQTEYLYPARASRALYEKKLSDYRHLRVLDLLNRSVNGILAYRSGSMNWMFKMMSPYLLLLITSGILVLLGTIFLITDIVRALAIHKKAGGKT